MVIVDAAEVVGTQATLAAAAIVAAKTARETLAQTLPLMRSTPHPATMLNPPPTMPAKLPVLTGSSQVRPIPAQDPTSMLLHVRAARRPHQTDRRSDDGSSR